MTHTWIIGASAGIGKALARELAGRGHRIALSARNEEALRQLHGELPGNGHLVLTLDVSDSKTVRRARENILRRWPQVDRVIYMAGIYQPMRMGEMDLDETGKILEVNLLGAFHITETVLPALLEQPGSQLAFCASVAGYRGLPGSQPYGASKAGLINMVESLKAEHGSKIDIKLINPGFVDSRLTDKNNFYMPARISTEAAARAIASGLESSRFEIHFPRRFTAIMKLLHALPHWIYYKIMRYAR